MSTEELNKWIKYMKKNIANCKSQRDFTQLVDLYIDLKKDKDIPLVYLYMISSFYDLGFDEIDFNYNVKGLNDNEIDLLLTFKIVKKLLKADIDINLDNFNLYFSKDGIADLLKETITNDFKLMEKLYNELLYKINFNNVAFPIHIYELLKPYIIIMTGIRDEKLDYLYEKIGNCIFDIDVRDDNFKILSNDDGVIEKIINLFLIEPIELNELNDKIYDSIKQEQFSHDYPVFRNIYERVLSSINNNDINELNGLKKLIKWILPKLNDDELENIIEEAKKNNTGELYDLSVVFIKKAREIYREKYNDMFKELKLPYYYDYYDSLKHLRLYLLKNYSYYDLKDYINISETLYNKLKDVIISNLKLSEDERHLYSKIRYLNNGLNKYIEDNIKDEYRCAILNDIDEIMPIKRQYYVPKVDIDMSSYFRKFVEYIDLITDIVNNEELYNHLCNTLRYYKLSLIPSDIYNSFCNMLGIAKRDDIDDLFNFIIYYPGFINGVLKNRNAASDKIIKLEDVRISFAELFKYLVSVNTRIDELCMLMTEEDYSIFVNDLGPGESGLTKESRLHDLVDCIINLYTNQFITIPSFDKDIEIYGKKINVVVGNRTNTCNLTHGERTGSCMRLGNSWGDSLFKFCLDNKNGFHIRFEDPNTHEYISRVSGFRNGNSLFLNQLRHSLNKNKYSDAYLIEAIKMVALEIIELTKDSKVPIENVFIDEGYAMKQSDLKAINLNVPNVKEGYDFFYSDVSEFCTIVLATNSSNDYSDINLDNSNVEDYKPVRDKVYGIEIGIEKLYEFINNRNAIKMLLQGFDYRYIETLDIDILDGFVGSDFYVYIDNNYELYYDYFDMDNYHDKDASLSEMNKYIKILSNKYGIGEIDDVQNRKSK